MKKHSKSSRKTTNSKPPSVAQRMIGVCVVALSVWMLTNRLKQFLGLVDGDSNNLNSIRVVNPVVASSTTVQTPVVPKEAPPAATAAQQERPVKTDPPKPALTEADLPQDWNEVLRMRAKQLQQQQPPPLAQQQQQQNQAAPQTHSNMILLRTDALFQKGTWDKAPIVLEQYKLVFFTVPKVGCTAFKQLFRRMMGHANWQDHQYYNEPFLPHNPASNGLKYLSDFSLDRANEMLTSPEWTRAIFVREPKERVLSGYLDKAGYSQGYYLRMRCCGRWQAGSAPWNMIQCGSGTRQYTEPAAGEPNTPILPFDDFLGHIMPTCPDPHWESQSTRMAPKYWERVNFVGRFETVYEDTKRLLEQVGAWDQFGASGWTTADGQDGAMFDPSQKAKHGTKAQDQSSKEQYFTPEALQMIGQYYKADYDHKVLKFEKPAI